MISLPYRKPRSAQFTSLEPELKDGIQNNYHLNEKGSRDPYAQVQTNNYLVPLSSRVRVISGL